jgi:asparagine synthase (glutamine-hydrolysing)
MCGIAGIVERVGTAVDAGLLDRMTDVLRHRGPDGRGTVILGPAGLGHRRLSIIDLATGAQPMTNADRSVWITFNGEIYNYRELRSELAARGRRFETTSDTEVIVAAYEAWGERCLERLRGMFAFAIWDVPRQQLFVARDRIGIKPLIYAFHEGRLLFGSEPKSVIQDASMPLELDWDGLRDYLTLLYVPSPRSIFRGMRKLEPGTYLTFRPSGEPQVRRYWTLTFAPDHSVTEDRWLDDLRRTLAEAVSQHLVSDVPVGAFLSGGIDSSTVVANMARAVREPVRTFSIGFDESDFDERRYARLVAQRFGTDHHEMVVKPDAMEVLPLLSWQFDEPFGDVSAIPTYYVSKIGREHVTVVLSGDGGDEGFAGYSRYTRALALRRRLDTPWLAPLKPLFRAAARLMPVGMRGRGRLSRLGADAIDRYLQMVVYQDELTGARILSPEARAQIPGLDGWQYLRDHLHALGRQDYLTLLQGLDFRTYLPEDILTKVDRTSMLVSLEARVPLLDHVLLELVARVPAALQHDGTSGKQLLKRALARDLPGEVLHRSKMGFGVPIARWFRQELAEYLRDVLLDRRTVQRGLFNRKKVERILRDHQSGRRDFTSQLWSLLVFEVWARTWLDHPARDGRSIVGA